MEKGEERRGKMPPFPWLPLFNVIRTIAYENLNGNG